MVLLVLMCVLPFLLLSLVFAVPAFLVSFPGAYAGRRLRGSVLEALSRPLLARAREEGVAPTDPELLRGVMTFPGGLVPASAVFHAGDGSPRAGTAMLCRRLRRAVELERRSPFTYRWRLLAAMGLALAVVPTEQVDLRLTFYLAMLFALASGVGLEGLRSAKSLLFGADADREWARVEAARRGLFGEGLSEPDAGDLLVPLDEAEQRRLADLLFSGDAKALAEGRALPGPPDAQRARAFAAYAALRGEERGAMPLNVLVGFDGRAREGRGLTHALLAAIGAKSVRLMVEEVASQDPDSPKSLASVKFLTSLTDRASAFFRSETGANKDTKASS